MAANVRKLRRDFLAAARDPSNLPMAVLGLLLVVVVAIGGSSRADIPSLVVLRPFALVCAALALLTVRRADLARHRFLLVWSAMVVALLVLQLVPLPPGLWTRLPGRDLIAEVDRTTGLGPVWRPMTMVPELTRNALWSMSVPIAVLLLAIQLHASQLQKVMLLVGVCIVASGFLAVMQIFAGPQSALYFYHVTHAGSGVGFFANRNHQALFLVSGLPILALALVRSLAVHRRRALVWGGAVATVLVFAPLILVTGSRSGLALSTVSFVLSSALVVACVRRIPGVGVPDRRGWLLLAAVVVAILVAVAAVLWVGRGIAVDRLVAQDPARDLRIRILPTVLAMTARFFVLGTGAGSFERVYQVYEPDALLLPTYTNHAHNDWLELVLTGGMPAVVLLVALLGWIVLKSLNILRQTKSDRRALSGMGAIVVLLCSLASLTDYPLRVPSIAALAMLCLVAMNCRTERSQAQER